MTDQLLQLVLLSLWCHGWHYLLSPGEALGFISRWAYEHFEETKIHKERTIRGIDEWYQEAKINTNNQHDVDVLCDMYNEKIEAANAEMERQIYILKPIFLCSICFASLYGTGGYLLLNYTTWGVFPVSIIALISVNQFIHKKL